MAINPTLYLLGSCLFLLCFSVEATNIPPENIISDCLSGSSINLQALLNGSSQQNCLQDTSRNQGDNRALSQHIMQALQKSNCYPQAMPNNTQEIALDLMNSNLISNMLRASFESYLKNVLNCDLNTDSEEKCLTNYRNRQLINNQPLVGNTVGPGYQSSPNPPVCIPTPINIIPQQRPLAINPPRIPVSPAPIQQTVPQNIVSLNQPVPTVAVPSAYPQINSSSNLQQISNVSQQQPLIRPPQLVQPSNIQQMSNVSQQQPLIRQPQLVQSPAPNMLPPQQPCYPNNNAGDYLQHELAELNRIRRNRSRRRRSKIEINCICLKSFDGLEDCKCTKIKEFRQKR